MLEAVALFNGKPPVEWTAEELAAFRARLEKSPSLVGAVGGQPAIDRRLAEVEAAVQQAKARPAVSVVEVSTPVEPLRNPIRLRRLTEAAVFLLLIGGAGYWIFSQLREMAATGKKEQDQAVAAQKDEPAEKPAEPKKAGPQSKAASQPTDAPPVGDLWNGWQVSAVPPGRWERQRDWDLSNPSARKYVEWLTFADGTVRLKQSRTLANNERWLEIRARPQGKANDLERMVVRVGGKEIAQLKIGTGEARWPAFVSLEPFVGQQVDLEVTYEAGEKGEQIAWKHMEFVPQKREIPKRINCGGPAIESPDGDWEADNNKSNRYLTSTGTRTWTVKTPVSVAPELQAVYQDERWANQYVLYRVPVEPGTYEVVLHVAETNQGFQKPGARQFDILLNGHVAAEKFDIVKAAGGTGAFQWRDRVDVKQGPLEIRLQGNPNGPAIKGLEILKVAPNTK